MRFEIVLVTPELAKKWLQKNISNRNVRTKVVKKYAADMKHGNWRFSGDAIALDKAGRVLNGQHRLLAVIEADIAIEMLVAFDVEPNAVFDQGSVRSTSDILHFQGIEISKQETAVVKFALRFYLNKGSVSAAQVGTYFKRREAFIQEAITASNTGNNRGIARNATVQFALMCGRIYGISFATCSDFCRVVNSGFSNGAEENAAVVIRNSLLENRFNITGARSGHFEEQVEKGLLDYSKKINRKMTYKPGGNPIKDKFEKEDAEFIKGLA